MTNIIIDGNWIFHKTFSVFRGFGKKLPQESLAGEGKGQFVRKLTTDLCHAISSLPKGSNIVMVIDRNSWRKSFFTPDKDLVNKKGYKGSREKNPEEDWTIFFDLITEYSAILEHKGFTISYISGAEGDDLAFKWSQYFKSKGENSIILSGDGDLSQLVSGISEPWTIHWNSNSKNLKLFSEPGWVFNWVESKDEIKNDLFNLNFVADEDKSQLRSLLKSSKNVELLPEDVILDKILSGDDGDDIPSCWHKKDSSPKGYSSRITGKKAEKIIAEIKKIKGSQNIKSYWKDEEFQELLAGIILKTIKDDDTEENRKLVKENLERNARLVWLCDEYLPDDLVTKIEEHIARKAETFTSFNTIDRKSLLEGTPYGFNNNTPSQFSPLDMI